jgi:hypothetical protein
MMEGVRWDPGMLRPYLNDRGVPTVTVNTGKMIQNTQTGQWEQQLREVPVRHLQDRGINSPVFNTTTLRKEQWLQLDQKVVRAARFRLRAYADLAAANSYGGFNGMSKMILEYETMSDPGDAVVDMDGLTQGQRNDQPLFQLQGLPLPITHMDFHMSSRMLTISRNGNTPLDTTMAEAAARRVGEMIEKTLIGNQTGITYGGQSSLTMGAASAYSRTSTVWGYTNFPPRIQSQTWYLPTGNGRATTPGGWVPLDLVKDVLGARQALYNNKFYGPWMIYHTNDWDQYLDSDYIGVVSAAGGATQGLTNQTLRDRLRMIEGIQDVRRLDMFFGAAPNTSTGTNPGGPGSNVNTPITPFQMVMVQMTPDVAQAVNGMDITVVQWEAKGGMQLNFKVMAIQVPKLQADFYGRCGILHATATHP